MSTQKYCYANLFETVCETCATLLTDCFPPILFGISMEKTKKQRKHIQPRN